jgi:hypothetical protein
VKFRFKNSCPWDLGLVGWKCKVPAHGQCDILGRW